MEIQDHQGVHRMRRAAEDASRPNAEGQFRSPWASFLGDVLWLVGPSLHAVEPENG